MSYILKLFDCIFQLFREVKYLGIPEFLISFQNTSIPRMIIERRMAAPSMEKTSIIWPRLKTTVCKGSEFGSFSLFPIHFASRPFKSPVSQSSTDPDLNIGKRGEFSVKIKWCWLEHGNACRKKNNNNYRCPRGCRKTKNGKVPFCSTMHNASRPCRNNQYQRSILRNQMLSNTTWLIYLR